MLHPRYSSRATVPYGESGKGLEIERTHKETWVIRKEISRMPFIQPWGNPYIPSCCTRISAQAGGKLPHQRWSQQCPTANHQAGQREHRNKQNVLAGWPETVLKMNPRNRGRPGPYTIQEPSLQKGLVKDCNLGVLCLIFSIFAFLLSIVLEILVRK